jgi:hypothetical protein
LLFAAVLDWEGTIQRSVLGEFPSPPGEADPRAAVFAVSGTPDLSAFWAKSD